MNTFSGFARKHSAPGIRNHVLVISAELACNPWALEVASKAQGSCALTHKHGQGNFGPDRPLFFRLLSGVATHPNVHGVVIVASGNEDYDPVDLVQKARDAGRKGYLFTARKIARNATLIRQAVARTRRLVAEARAVRRTELDVSQLSIGLNCAGTDTASRYTSNVVCGAATDLLVKSGATVLLSEVPELIGVRRTFLERCRAGVRKKLERLVAKHRRRLSRGGGIDENELCEFNRQGQLSTLAEKANISVLKAGTSPVNEVVAYGEAPSRAGLVVMDGPAMTDFVMTGFMGAGVHMMINCCGVGPANRMPVMVGCDCAPPILPAVKVTGSSRHFRDKTNRIDFDAGAALKQPELVQELAQKLVKRIVQTASGKATRTERTCNFFMNVPVQRHQA